MYLLNPRKKKSAAHLWTGSNTVCKMYQTGGMTKRKQQLSATTMGKQICTMCLTVNAKSKNPVYFVDKEYLESNNNYFIQLPNI